MDIRAYASGIEAKEQAGIALQALLSENNACRAPVLILVSGGSAFSLLEELSSDAASSQTTWSVLDERFSADSAVNNFAQFMNTDFFAVAVSRGASVIDTRALPDETPEQLARRFEHALRAWKKQYSAGTVIATMGIGPDGHTAGIMPFPDDSEQFSILFEDKTRWAVSYNAGKKTPFSLRITISMPFLRACVDHAIVFAAGEEKSDALRRVTAPDGSLAETPARIIHEMKDVIVRHAVPA